MRETQRLRPLTPRKRKRKKRGSQGPDDGEADAGETVRAEGDADADDGA